ncbi:hypothetical protein Acr_00g0092710 [Actinidia rufa]|uniref:Uncharacterized protein n=1 Tax=Actinidia rufa TaxID=165716 RepID=A0A7J0DYR2_9ERIC|nr:hypothetical protein Acr_00g0092710 [Actinidia rufa]
MALARTVPVFDSVYTKLRRRGPPSLLCSNNSVEASALARPESVFVKVYTELRCRGPSSLLHSNNSFETSALTATRPGLISLRAQFEYCYQGPPLAPMVHLVWTRGRVTTTCP